MMQIFKRVIELTEEFDRKYLKKRVLTRAYTDLNQENE